MEDYFYLSIYEYLDYLVACKIKKIASVMTMNLKSFQLNGEGFSTWYIFAREIWMNL